MYTIAPRRANDHLVNCAERRRKTKQNNLNNSKTKKLCSPKNLALMNERANEDRTEDIDNDMMDEAMK